MRWARAHVAWVICSSFCCCVVDEIVFRSQILFVPSSSETSSSSPLPPMLIRMKWIGCRNFMTSQPTLRFSPYFILMIIIFSIYVEYHTYWAHELDKMKYNSDIFFFYLFSALSFFLCSLLLLLLAVFCSLLLLLYFTFWQHTFHWNNTFWRERKKNLLRKWMKAFWVSISTSPKSNLYLSQSAHGVLGSIDFLI